MNYSKTFNYEEVFTFAKELAPELTKAIKEKISETGHIATPEFLEYVADEYSKKFALSSVDKEWLYRDMSANITVFIDLGTQVKV